ncbi:lipopolysaccharide biosynthesis protein [Carboxylicivirga linearis]|uniref:Oligosaccharide flippase family protein n=1 Tax=Carboxylicivirga linearis TaxID=1628157 RepID=A0ABS5K0W9_9BACT|nr:oligosaccharide flippase family protein [Carboxylicivirga linearis]MBS2100777.1 oligosaccharide flippase family protein [Carboxylicivirga linearis]
MKNILIKWFGGKDLSELLKHSFNYLSGDFLSKGLVFITLPLFTRIMTPNDYGVLSVYNSFVSLVAIFFGFGTRGAIVRYYHEKNRDFSSFLGTTLIFLLFIFTSLFSLSFLFEKDLETYLNIPTSIVYMGLLGGAFISIFDIYKAFLQASKRSKKYAKINVVNTVGFISLAIIFILILPLQNYLSYAIAKVLMGSLVLVYCLIQFNKIAVWQADRRHLAYVVKFSIPIVFHLLSQNVLTSFDQLIINSLVGPESTGLYSVGYKVGMIQNIFVGAFMGAWSPLFYQKMNEKSFSDIHSLIKKYAKIISLSAIFLIFFSKELLLIFSTKVYYEAYKVIPYVVMGYFLFFIYSVYSGYLLYHKKNIFLAIFTILVGIFNIVMNYLLIPKWGYIAAAWTTVLSYLLLVLIHYSNVIYGVRLKGVIPLRVFGVSSLYVVIAVSLVSFQLVEVFGYRFVCFLIMVLGLFGKSILTKKNI